MEQHPVPQSISSYQFKLVGDMTLKQFLQLAGGVVLALLVYATGLHPIIKWPLILFFVGLGIALAFLPFEERPLESWIVSFFRSIYSPTLFYWQKTQAPVSFFQPEQAPTTPSAAPTEKPFYSKLPFVSTLEEAEKTFLVKVTQLFGPAAPPTTTLPTAPLAAIPQPGPQPMQKKTEFEVPKTTPTEIMPEKRTSVVVEEKIVPVAIPSPTLQMTGVGQVLGGQGAANAQAAQFSLEAAPPNPPTSPNIIVGQVMDIERRIVEGAILEVRDLQGRPVRALRSNKAGHFMIVTPLANDKYEIITDKEGLAFDPITFEANGGIIPPIAVTAKGKQAN